MISFLYNEFDRNLALNESPLSAYYLACPLMLDWDSLPCKLGCRVGSMADSAWLTAVILQTVVWLGSSIETIVISTPPTVSILAGVEHLTPCHVVLGDHYNGLLSEMGPRRRFVLRLAPGDCFGINCQLACLAVAAPPSSLGVDG